MKGAVCLVAALALAAGTEAATGNSSMTAQALGDLNAWRAEAGVPSVVRFSETNNNACALHDHYMSLLGGLSHDEQPGRPGYTAAGADSGMHSILAYPEGMPRETWVDAVYHRLNVLQPRLRVSGFAAEDGFTCLRVTGPAVDDSRAARTPKLTLYPWPPEGATDQPVTFGRATGETPSPLLEAPGATTLGLLLSVNVNGPWADHAAAQSIVTAATLVSAAGDIVQLAVSDSTTRNGLYLSGGFALLPMRQLERGTQYTAHAKGKVTAFGVSYPFDFTWHFSTTGGARSGLGAGASQGNGRAAQGSPGAAKKPAN